MFIVNQRRTELINLDNVTVITREETTRQDKIQYWADTTSSDTFKLGEYENTSEHENLIEKIAKSIGATDVYYMPEE